MNETPSVLIVEDSESMAALFVAYLDRADIAAAHVASAKLAYEYIKQSTPDLVLLDLKLPDADGAEILKWIRKEGFPTSVIVVTNHGSVDVAVDVMRMGAEDFIEKPVTSSRLITTVNNVLEKHRLKYLVAALTNTFERKGYHGFIGSSLPMQAVYRIIDAAAPSKATVFITGESGTGKEVCAEAIHKQGKRKDAECVALNCAAIPHDLMESEIFGHVKGAYTGASSDREGAATKAHGGTLFLDEICEMDLDLQAKLLRFIQTGTFQKVGSNKVSSVDVRFVCATNRDPLAEVQIGNFREDLYYRLHVIPLNLPPLRERGNDIVDIAQRFLVKYSKEEDKSFRSFSHDVTQVLTHYDWPGNVRQLQNVIRNIVVLHDKEVVSLDCLPPPLDSVTVQSTASSETTLRKPAYTDATSSQAENPTLADTVPVTSASPTIRPLADIEREVIEHAIAQCDGNIPKAASMLAVSPSTIYRKKQMWDEAQ